MSDELRTSILSIIEDIAPDGDPSAISGDEDFREALGLDSMDFLGVIERIAEVHGVEVPEADYAKVNTINAMVEYLKEQSHRS